MTRCEAQCAQGRCELPAHHEGLHQLREYPPVTDLRYATLRIVRWHERIGFQTTFETAVREVIADLDRRQISGEDV